MRALRASAMVLSRDGGGGGSNGSNGGGGFPPASPYMRGTVSAPPTAVEATYSYAPEVRGGLGRPSWVNATCATLADHT